MGNAREVRTTAARRLGEVYARHETNEPSTEPEGAIEASADPVRLGKYRLLRRLGEGATSIVYEAVDDALGRLVALKVLKGCRSGSPSLRRRFHREAKAAAGLCHPNLVAIYEFHGDADPIHIAMPLVRGTSLEHAFRRRGLAVRDLVGLLEKVARAVAHAHEYGVIHRDLKPANILIDERGEPQVIDFGLVHFQIDATALTESGTVLGTPAYMAPEQIHGCRRVDASTDVYALGAILYEGLAGHSPFTGRNVQELFQRILSDDPQPLRRRDARIHRDLETVCTKALEKDPSRRYQSAGAFADDLRRFLNGEPIFARPRSGWTVAVRSARKHSGVTAAAAVLFACLAAATAFRAAEHFRDEREAKATRVQAEACFAKGEYDAAARILEPYLLGHPADREAHDLQTRCDARIRERVRTARDSAIRAVRILEFGSDLRNKTWDAGKLLLHDRTMRDARAEINRALAIVPNDVEFLLIKGRILRETYALEDAYAALTRALGIDPKAVQARYERGLTALRSYTLLTLDAHWGGLVPEAIRWLALVRADLQELKEEDFCPREAEYLKVFQRFTDGKLRGAEPSPQEEDPEVLSVYAEQAVADGRPASALALRERAVKQRPGDPMLWYLLANTHLVIAERNSLVCEFLSRLVLGHADEDALRVLHAPAYERIAETFGRALEIWPEFVEARTGRGWMRWLTGNGLGAVEDVRRAVDLGRRNRNARVLLARFLHAGGSLEESLREIQVVISGTPDDADALHARADILAALERRDEERADRERILGIAARRLRQFPESWEALESQVAELDALHRTGEARKTRERMLRIVEEKLRASPRDLETLLHWTRLVERIEAP